MTKLFLQRESIEPRLDGMQKDIVLLRQFAQLPFNEFTNDIVVDRAQLHLRYALESVFNISSHILSRLPGGRYTEYKEMARKMGEQGIVPRTFADEVLVKMAGYRNRLTHFYAEVTARELYDILQHHLTDIETFLSYIKAVLQDPEKFALKLE